MNNDRFKLDFNNIDLKSNQTQSDNNILGVNVGQYVKLKETKQVVKIIEKPFVLDDNILSDYLGLDLETNKEILFNNDNILEIVDYSNDVSINKTY